MLLLLRALRIVVLHSGDVRLAHHLVRPLVKKLLLLLLMLGVPWVLPLHVELLVALGDHLVDELGLLGLVQLLLLSSGHGLHLGDVAILLLHHLLVLLLLMLLLLMP